MPVDFLSVDDVLRVHANQVERYGGDRAVRDIASHTANTAPETPASRRTVLLLLDHGNDAMKSGVYDRARRAGW